MEPEGGYRVVITSFEYVATADEAYHRAMDARESGKRSEIITSAEYEAQEWIPMQDLLLFRRQHILGLPS